MPRNSSRIEVTLALSPSAASRALNIRPERVAEAIEAGKLIVRNVPGSLQRRIPVFGERGLQQWFDRWAIAQPRKAPNHERFHAER